MHLQVADVVAVRREGIINADSRSTDVSPSFQRDVNDGLKYTQFRLSMRPNSDFDGVFDYIWFNDENLQLTVKALVE